MAHPTGSKWTEFISSEVALRNLQNKKSKCVKDSTAQLPLELTGSQAHDFYSNITKINARSSSTHLLFEDVVEIQSDSDDEVQVISEKNFSKLNNEVQIINTAFSNMQTFHLKEQYPSDDVSMWCDDCCDYYTGAFETHACSIIHQFNFNKKHKGAAKPSFYIPQNNKGYQMLLSLGWNGNAGLGLLGQGPKYPVKTVLKLGRGGLGTDDDGAPKVSHFSPNDPSEIMSKKPLTKNKNTPSGLCARKGNKRKNELSAEQQRDLQLRREIYGLVTIL